MQCDCHIYHCCVFKKRISTKIQELNYRIPYLQPIMIMTHCLTGRGLRAFLKRTNNLTEDDLFMKYNINNKIKYFHVSVCSVHVAR